MKVINFFGGPGSGKSTTAAGLFHHMKRRGYKVELVTEYAKDMVYESRANIMADQLYVLAKQARRVSRLEGHVDYVITDSPLLLSIIYNQGTHLIDQLAEELFDQYDNVCFQMQRGDNYQEFGRGQTQEESEQIDREISAMLSAHGVRCGEKISSSVDFAYLLACCD
jgi:Ni2+-binding GTPase involved in maturation of urease and hydrogenase